MPNDTQKDSLKVDLFMDFVRIVRKMIKTNQRENVMFAIEMSSDNVDYNQMTKDILAEKFPTQKRFSLMIEELSKEINATYVDTRLHYCEKNEIDVESVSKLINPTLKDKIQREYEQLNMLPKTPKLKKH